MLHAFKPWWVVLGLMLISALWVSIAGLRHTALHHDMAEQFVWAHAWQLGYPKHPPLPTWLFMLALEVFPARPSTLYGLSALCVGATGVFTYLGARALLGERQGLCVALLWGLQQPFAWRAWIYNHNTVLVMCVAFTAMCTLLAVKRSGWAWWVAAGVGAALSMSTKLQAIVPLAGIVWALWRGGYLGQAAHRQGLAWALGMALLFSAAPLWWMLAGHTNALAYATHQLGSDAERTRLLQFVMAELRMLAPTLLVMLSWVALGRRSHRTSSAQADDAALQGRAWAEGLVLVPLVAVLAMGLLGGAKLHAQWGVQTFQFVALALVIGYQGLFDEVALPKLVGVVALVQLVSLSLAASVRGDRMHAPGAVQGYPSAVLAQRVQADWQREAPGCPLRYVSAPFFEGGQLSAYVSSHPVVLEDGQPKASPWVDVQDMARAGSVVLVNDPGQLPSDVWHTRDMTLSPPDGIRGVPPVYWGIRRPSNACMPEAAP